jgi:hypothetical protein
MGCEFYKRVHERSRGIFMGLHTHTLLKT